MREVLGRLWKTRRDWGRVWGGLGRLGQTNGRLGKFGGRFRKTRTDLWETW